MHWWHFCWRASLLQHWQSDFGACPAFQTGYKPTNDTKTLTSTVGAKLQEIFLQPKWGHINLTFSSLDCPKAEQNIFFWINVNVWVRGKVKSKPREKEYLSCRSASEGSSPWQPPGPLSAAVLLQCWLCFQGWQFKYSFHMLRERTVSSRVSLQSRSGALLRKHSRSSPLRVFL